MRLGLSAVAGGLSLVCAQLAYSLVHLALYLDPDTPR